MTVPDLSYPDMGWRTNEIEMHVTGGKLVVAYYRIYVDGELISATTWSPGTA